MKTRLFKASQEKEIKDLAALAWLNPFEVERAELEDGLLGAEARKLSRDERLERLRDKIAAALNASRE
ncbi:MAG: hypothetical protein AAGF10_07215, partial [Verrucomicrobiota bacterium]